MQTLIMLVGLCVGLGTLWFGIQWAMRNQGQVEAVLDRVGVPVPKGPAPEDGTPLPDIPHNAPPPEPIILSQFADLVPEITQAMKSTPQEPTLTICGQQFGLHPGSFTIGRDDNCTIYLADQPSISRQHAEVGFDGTVFSVCDLGSTNGTFVNGSRLSSHAVQVIHPGDRLQFGACEATLTC